MTESTMQIPLTRGKTALVDSQDLHLVEGLSWHAQPGRYTWYAATRIGKKVIKLHRIILGATSSQVVDHINGDGLDNRRCNLRICSQSENMRNRRSIQVNNRSGYLGVTPHQGDYRARICVNGKRINIGVFGTGREAAIARDEAAIALHGEFAQTNQKLGLLDSRGAK